MEITTNNTPVLRFLRDHTNVQTLRDIMWALYFRVTGRSRIGIYSFEDIFFHEAESAERLLKAAAHNRLFTMLLVQFSSSRYNDDELVLQTTDNLDRMTIQAVQDPESRPEKEYLVVLDLCNKIVGSKGTTYPSLVSVSQNSTV